MITKHFVRMTLSLAVAFALMGVAHGEELHVFAAASLTEAFAEIAKTFKAAHRGVSIEFNFAGSQILRTQIEQGAAADVFASADRVHAEALQEKKLLGATSIFARNVLVVITPTDAPRVSELTDLTRPGIKIVVASPTVPVGRYTSQALRTMAGSGLYGDDFQTRVQTNVASQELNVRAVLAKVALGEADAGFVYRTDAMTATTKVRVLAIPQRLNVVAEYPIGVLARSSSRDLAREFVELVTGPDGQAILRKYGFTREVHGE
ncbi:MAG: molybdate ABC transporter substrate-binding protein [candidate division Zixibacteria bacterium]|nr:molybdate ABC transporter substrate-binding protein [candidate division Zixibacteria bacterium]